jgi:maltose alpha-D-glucosyltransferase/alpha-amylase
MLGRQNFLRSARALPRYAGALGFFWFLLCEHTAEASETPRRPTEFETLVVSNGLSSLWQSRSRTILERDVLPAFLATRRWFPERGSTSITARIETTVPLGAAPDVALAVVEAKGNRKKGWYLLPLAITWQRLDRDKRNPNALCAVRHSAREGGTPRCGTPMPRSSQPCWKSHGLWPRSMRARVSGNSGRSARLRSPTLDNVRQWTPRIQHSAGGPDVVKLAGAGAGHQPEIDVGRFLTETVGFPNTPPLLGTVEWIDHDSRSAALVVHRFVQNQGDAWSVTNAYLDRYIEEQRLLTNEPSEETDEQTAYLSRARQIGRRVAEMQIALASRDDLAEFAPEPITAEDMQDWVDKLLRQANHALDELARRRAELQERDLAAVDALLAQRVAVRAVI